MATTLSAADTGRLNQALATWRQWSPAFNSAPQWQAKLGGLSNINILVTAATAGADRQAVVRLHNNNAHLGVNRHTERSIQACAAQAGIAPAWLYWQQEFSVVEYVTGAHFCPGQDHRQLTSIGHCIYAIHQLSPSQGDAPAAGPASALDPQQHLQHYWQLALHAGATKPAGALHARRHRQLQAEIEVRLALALERQTPVWCHNDLSGANLLLDDQRLMVIDWEYSSPGQALFDLAVCIHSNRLNKQQATALLGAYAEGLALQQVRPYLQVYAAIEALWFYLQNGNAAQLQARLTNRMLTNAGSELIGTSPASTK
jgi:thiamine kinase-like enzyme